MQQVLRARLGRRAAGAALAAGAVLAAVAAGGSASAAPAPGSAALGSPARQAATGLDDGTATAPPKVLLGTVGGVTTSKTNTSRVQAFQSQVGRSMATVRMYAVWDNAWPDTTSLWARNNGQTVFLSVKSKLANGTAVPYRAIADSQPGDPYYTRLVQWAQAVKGFGAPVMFTYNHEPEAAKSDAMGSSAEYVAAWRKVVTVFRQQGVTNAEYVFIGTDYGWGRTDARAAAGFYPGDEYVDDIGADAYNWFTCRPKAQIAWRSLQQIIEPLRQFGLKHPTKGLVVPEIGTVEDPAQPNRKAQWYSDARAMFAQPGYAQFREVGEWYGPVGDACNWRVDSSTAALQAFRAWGADPQYTAMAVVPSQPRQVQAATNADGDLRVTWAPAGPGGSPVTSYRVLVQETGEVFGVDASQGAYVYRPAGAPRAYSFTVKAVSAAGVSVASAVTPQQVA